LISTGGDDADDEVGGTAPCLLHELGPNGAACSDPRLARDVARWRKVERERLIEARLALAAEYRAAQTSAMVSELNQLIPINSSTIVSVYWPIKAEPDLRPWMHASSQRGVCVALPVAIAVGQPLAFREWRPNIRMARGLWKIPYPASGVEVVPTVVIAPLVGFDEKCFRLGYGGGFFDRTLEGMATRPLVIGVGFPGASIRTIFPQPHDIPMDWIVTGAVPSIRRDARATGQPIIRQPQKG
jgi:5,10-methenyltetrahydrofolate synthetase